MKKLWIIWISLIAMLALTISGSAQGLPFAYDIRRTSIPTQDAGFIIISDNPGTDTSAGEFKVCSTDAYFFLYLYNNTNQDVSVTLPRRASLENRSFPIDPLWKYATITTPEISRNQYANANNASAPTLILSENNSFVLPALTALSVRGKIINFSHDMSRPQTTGGPATEKFSVNMNVLFNETTLKAQGALYADNLGGVNSVCHNLNFSDVTPGNQVEGYYYYEKKDGYPSCSMNYYFIIENPDPKYSAVVELPRWIMFDGKRYNIGCDPLEKSCPISGFRHYAYSPYHLGEQFMKADYQFCTEDQIYGDRCYHEIDLWWLRLPPQSFTVVRGMVNDLCNVPNENPLKQTSVEISFPVSEAAAEKIWINGVVKGTKYTASSAKDLIPEPGYALIETRDLHEDISIFLMEDPTLAESTMILDPEIGPPETKSVSETQQNLASVLNASQTNFSAVQEITLDTFRLPETGFSVAQIPALPSMPPGFSYTNLGNYSIEIPLSGVSATIVGVPQTSQDEWSVAWLNQNVGLLEGSALPGEGIALLAGHNHLSNGTPGPFASLSVLQENDQLFIRKPDGTLIQFKIYANILTVADNHTVLSEFATQNSLALITCENESIQGGYLDRRIIFAKPILN